MAARATILGMKLRLCSWMEVTAWKMDTISPTTSPTSIIGPPISSASFIAWVARLTTVSWFMTAASWSWALVEARDERVRDDVPAVHQDEQQDLERHRDEARWEHHHADAHQCRGDDQVDDQEREEDQEPDLE